MIVAVVGPVLVVFNQIAVIAQEVEHFHGKEEVIGSNPINGFLGGLKVTDKGDWSP